MVRRKEQIGRTDSRGAGQDDSHCDGYLSDARAWKVEVREMFNLFLETGYICMRSLTGILRTKGDVCLRAQS